MINARTELQKAEAEYKDFLSMPYFEGYEEIDQALQEQIEMAREIDAEEAAHVAGWEAWEAEQIAAGTFSQYTEATFILGDVTL